MTLHADTTGFHLAAEDLARAATIAEPTIRIRAIFNAVSAETGIPVRMLTGEVKRPNVVRARHLVWFIARREGFSLVEIARVTGHDHTTVRHGILREQAARAAQ